MIRSFLFRAAAAAGLVCALTLGCSGDDGGPRIPAAIVLVPNQPKIPQGLSVKLTATVVDASGRAIPGQPVTFGSDEPTIVTVDATGLMHAVGPLGTARVTADLNGLTAFVDVEVTQRVVSLTVTPESLIVNRGLTGFLTVTLRDFLDQPVNPVSVVDFTSNDSTIAAVDQFGQVRAKDQIARTVVRVTVDSFRVDVPVRVVAIPGSITVDPVNVVLPAGGTQQLTVTVVDIAGKPILSPQLSFSSGAPGLFSVSAGGLVSALAPSGTGTLTITADSLQQAVGVFVGATSPVAITHHTLAEAGLYEVDIGPNGQLVVSAPDGGKFYRGTLPSASLPYSFSAAGSPLGVAVNHAGTRAYVTVSSGLRVLDLVTNTQLPAIAVQGGGAKVAVVISNDDQLAYLGTDLYVYVIDLAAGNAIDSIPAFTSFFLALHPTQPLLYVGEGVPREINLTTKVVRAFTGGYVKDLVVSPDGTELYGGDEGGGVHIFSIAGGNEIQTLQAGGAFGMAASSKYLVAVGNNTADIFDRVTRAHLRSVVIGGVPRRPAINSTETTIVVPNEAGWLDYIQ